MPVHAEGLRHLVLETSKKEVLHSRQYLPFTRQKLALLFLQHLPPFTSAEAETGTALPRSPSSLHERRGRNWHCSSYITFLPSRAQRQKLALLFLYHLPPFTSAEAGTGTALPTAPSFR
ncbi:hypothetical protein AVEN_217289-1 [Araneus ventricosus]|uniref:Uncharacterized protein n=1 Tax=Araneus ventricosus TaxID=182803 RepID=A0A4Y2G139_ARAVE|nr:hypothetical protein AVEN_217289-1 [Araneus ventricosus]